ncbi:MAG: hypothetical protein IPN13_07865 [Bacteroidetes bacterium]|nr:hypothetical protein [Bacteroidota bacterium]
MSKFLQIAILKVLLLTCCYNLFSQTPSIQWKRLIGGSNTEKIKKIELIPTKGYVVLGSTNSCDGIIQNFHGQEDVFVLFLDFSGNIKWIKSFGGASSEKPIDLIFHPYEEKIGVLMSSISKDGDFSFKNDDMYGSFFTYLNLEGEALNSLGSTSLCNNGIQPTVGKKLAMSGKSSYLLRTDSYFGTKKEEFRTILSVIFSRRFDENPSYQNISSTREEFSCHPASMKIDDLFSIVDLVDSKDIFGQSTGFITIGNTNTAKIFTMEYNDIKKGGKYISLKHFHSNEQKKTDAFILNLNREVNYIKLKAGSGICIGGKGSEIAHQIFHTGFETYRCIITSDSYDGDFKANKGKGDIWAVDFDKKLKINRILNLGTVQDDKFVSAINSEKSTAVLLYSGNANASATDQNSDSPLANSEINANGLRLIQFDDKELLSEVNFNLHDLNARVFRTIEQKLIVTSLIPKGKTNALGVICIEPLSGKVIWQKIISDYDFVSADYLYERIENNFYIIGSAKDTAKPDSQPDIFFMNLNSRNLAGSKPVLFMIILIPSLNQILQ